MSDPTLPPADDAALAAFREAAQPEPVSPFSTARAWRSLERALDADARSRVRWTPLRVGLVALAAGFAGAGGFGLVTHASRVEGTVAVAPSAVTPVAAPSRAPSMGASSVGASSVGGPSVGTPSVETPSVGPSPGTPSVGPSPGAPSGLAEVAVVAPRVKPAPRSAATPARSWREQADALVERGDGVGAARVLVKALAADDGAGAALSLVARRFPDALDAVDADLARLKSAEAMRIRCEQKLLHKRDREAVEVCRAFGLEHPESPGARPLAFAAGRVAEDVGDLALAEEAYSRALVLSSFVGVTDPDPLLSRARVRAARGDLDNARADLRLYLHNVPGAKDVADVAALAARLGL